MLKLFYYEDIVYYEYNKSKERIIKLDIMKQQKNEKITIVSVVFNAAIYLEETIKGVLSQDYNNIEYIIIDGGSKDETVDIIKKYEKHISYWISESDNGIYDAMNKGIDRATGEWINFMNAGDTFYDGSTVSKVIKQIDNSTDLISGDIYYIKDNMPQYYKAKGIEHTFNGMFCFHQTLFTKTSIMKKIKFSLEFSLAGDYDFVLKCFTLGYKFKFLNFAIANFISGGQAELNPVKARIEEMFIQSKYLKNELDIFNLSSYARFESLKSNNNRVFAKFINNLYNELEDLNLGEKRFILYGYGHIGEIIYQKYKNNIVSIVDKNFLELNKSNNINILDIKEISNIQADDILISVLGREKEIINMLQKDNLLSKKHVLSIKI